MSCVQTPATIHRPLRLVVGYQRWSTGAAKLFQATFAVKPEALAKHWIVARHAAEARGGFGGTSERVVDTADPTCPEEEEGAAERDREDLETTLSAAKREQSE